jgi:hypothetical protein
MSVSVPVAWISGAAPVAAFFTVIWFTGDVAGVDFTTALPFVSFTCVGGPLVGEQDPPSAHDVPLIVIVAPEAAFPARPVSTYASVASFAVPSPWLCVVAVVPFGNAGVPLTLLAVPVVFWFNVGKSPAAAMPSTPVVVVLLRMPVPNAPSACAFGSAASAVCTMYFFADTSAGIVGLFVTLVFQSAPTVAPAAIPSSFVLSVPLISPALPAATTFAITSLPPVTCVVACAAGVREFVSRVSLPLTTSPLAASPDAGTFSAAAVPSVGLPLRSLYAPDVATVASDEMFAFRSSADCSEVMREIGSAGISASGTSADPSSPA